MTIFARRKPAIDLQPKTKDFFLRLEQADWFSDVGQPLPISAFVSPVNEWTQALEVCASRSSDEACVEAQNELTVNLSRHHSAAYAHWNAKVDVIKPKILRLVEQKLATPAVRARVPDHASRAFTDTLNWDLVAICMAKEYEDFARTKYYELLEYWFLAGHFPCGWLGEVPDDFAGAFDVGKLAVF